MRVIAKKFDDQEIAAVAAYYGALPAGRSRKLAKWKVRA